MFNSFRHSVFVAAAITGLAGGAGAHAPRTRLAVLPSPRPHLGVVDCDGQFSIRTAPAAPCPPPLPAKDKGIPAGLDLGLNLRLDRSLFLGARALERSDAAR